MIDIKNLSIEEKKYIFEKLLGEFAERKKCARIEYDNYLSDENDPFNENEVARLFIFNQPRDYFLGEKIEKDFSLENLKKDYYIFDVCIYDHGVLNLYLGKNPIDRFDSWNAGIIAITRKDYTPTDAGIEAINMLNLYNQYINGEIYQVLIFENKKINIDGETFENKIVIDLCGGFYSVEDAKNWILSCYGDIEINEA